MVRKSLDYHGIARRAATEKSPAFYDRSILVDPLPPEGEQRRFNVIDRAVEKKRAEMKDQENKNITALYNEELPKMKKELEEDKKIQEMKETVEKSLHKSLSSFVGDFPDAKETRKMIADEVVEAYREVLHLAKDLIPAEFTPFDFLEEKAGLLNMDHLLDEEKRKLLGTEPTTIPSSENNQVKHGWIQSFTGKKLYPLDPRMEDICIRDIAHNLSNICRFAGACREFYSVAQHSVLVSYLSGSFAEHGLLHDASEGCGLGDLVKPIKKLDAFAGYREAEARMQTLIYRKFDLNPVEPEEVKEADIRVFATEARDLRSITHPDWMAPCEPYPFIIKPLPPKEAEQLFLYRFKDLMLKRYGNEEQYQRYMAE
jgi:uncharacterized protein